ncbi:hypothetical protein MHLP_03685 [Candidatus Mycoplasma haematolamae str. Purdue]|uniref:Uncharacterized protein n=1 Tax=Mycoplasma haematolamae (strain Purdue) TaxID=1212765 RepID=I7C6Y7_MYCHA|nr:hypothetical protein [Candidatus Mycoplasma haematolamae]AFO52317.1 hypothetical protein MHLP_03685 [Candidatus Mycoplasma haematolamae str. Purdue]
MSLWLKGLSAQGKIYLATSSLALGAGVTGSLAVDDTRESIWSGVNYVGSSVSGFLGQAFKVGNAPPRPEDSRDETITSLFVEALRGLGFFVQKGAELSWKSVTYTGQKVTEAKETYQTVKVAVQTTWPYLSENWKTLWYFFLGSFRSIDLQKLYGILSSDKASKVLGSQGQSQLGKTVEGMKKLITKSGEVGFNLSQPFSKIMRYFLNKPNGISEINRRLDILNSFLENTSIDDKKAKSSLVEFFSSEENDITSINYTPVKFSR